MNNPSRLFRISVVLGVTAYLIVAWCGIFALVGVIFG